MLTFRDAPTFVKTIWTATLGAGVATAAAPWLAAYLNAHVVGASIPLVYAIAACASLGAFVGIAFSMKRPQWLWQRMLVAVGMGLLCFAACLAAPLVAAAPAFLLPILTALIGIVAAGMGTYGENRLQPWRAHALSIVGGMAWGAAAGFAVNHLDASLLHSGGALANPLDVSSGSALMGFGIGLWTLAGVGLGRIEPKRDPLLLRLLDAIAEVTQLQKQRRSMASAVANKQQMPNVLDELLRDLQVLQQTYQDLESLLSSSSAISQSLKADVYQCRTTLTETCLSSTQQVRSIDEVIFRINIQEIHAKITNLDEKLLQTDDPTTKAHLTRSLQALRAQIGSFDALRKTQMRASSAIDANIALLERLRLAVAQQRVSLDERFAVELQSVTEQADKMSDEIESFHFALDEAANFTDQQVLLDAERRARVALQNISTLPNGINAPVVTPAANPVAPAQQEEAVAVAVSAKKA